MRFLSKEANLSAIYTNHSIRATVITNLNNSGYEARHIIAVTGHKSESTVKQYATKKTKKTKQYATKCLDSKKREMCDSLAKNLCPEKKVKTEQDDNSQNAIAPQSTINPFPTLNLNDLDIQLQQLPTDPDDLLLSQVLDDIEKQYGTSDKKDENTNPQINPPVPEPQPQPQNQNKPNHPESLTQVSKNVQNQNLVTTVNNISNVVQRRPPQMPSMYFPHSSVTINYNIINKQ